MRPAVNRLLELGLLRACSKAGITFATSAEEIQFPVASSRIASVYWIVVQAASGMAAMARFTAESIRAVIDTLAPARCAAVTTAWP